MQYVRADTITEVVIGPAVAVGDGFVPITSLSIASADEAEFIKHNATAVTAIGGTLGAVTNADGYYTLDISAAETDTEGRLTLLINDDSLILPIRMEFMVVNANVFDSLFAVAGTDLLQVDLTQIIGGTVPTPTTTGILDVNVERWLDTLVTLSASLPDVNVETMDAASIATGVLAAGALTEIEDEIWDALKSVHVVADSFGDFLDDEITSRSDPATAQTITAGQDVNVASMDAGSIASGVIAAAELTNIENEIWDALKSAHVVANSFGDFLDIEVSSRSDPATAQTITAGQDVNVASMDAASIASGVIAAAELTNIENEIWDALKAAHVVANSFGDFLDVEVTSRSAPGTAQTITANQDVNVNQWLTSAAPALVGSRLDASVGAMASAVLTATAIATDAITNTKIAAGAITSSEAPNLDAAITTRATPAQVNTEVSDVLKTDTIAELSNGAQAVTPTFETAIMLMYMALRSQLDIDASFKEIHTSSGTLIAKKALTDDTTTYREATMVAGT